MKQSSFYNTAECVYEVNVLADFVAEKGDAINMGEMANVVESLQMIKCRVEESYIIPSDLHLADKLGAVLEYITESPLMNVASRTITSLTSLLGYVETFSK